MDDRLITGTVLYQEPPHVSPFAGWAIAATVVAGMAVLAGRRFPPRLPGPGVGVVIRA